MVGCAEVCDGCCFKHAKWAMNLFAYLPVAMGFQYLAVVSKVGEMQRMGISMGWTDMSSRWCLPCGYMKLITVIITAFLRWRRSVNTLLFEVR